MKIIQISDLHLSRFCFNPLRLLNKRIIGQINLLINRQFKISRDRMRQLFKHLATQDFDHLILSGDLVTTALESEYTEIRELLDEYLKLTTKNFSIIPGNHDRYVGEAHKKHLLEQAFADFIPNGRFPFEKNLSDKILLIGIDVCHPEGLFRANGRLRSDVKTDLEERLARATAKNKIIILACHFPVLLPPGKKDGLRHSLENKKDLAALIQKYKVHLFLHGHIHERWILEGDDFFPSICVNGGCSSAISYEKMKGGGYNLIDIAGKTIKVQSFGLDKKSNEFIVEETKTFQMD